MQKDSDKPLGAEKHLLAGTVAGKQIKIVKLQCITAMKHCTPSPLYDHYLTHVHVYDHITLVVVAMVIQLCACVR